MMEEWTTEAGIQVLEGWDFQVGAQCWRAKPTEYLPSRVVLF
jgi:hypothetical protein